MEPDNLRRLQRLWWWVLVVDDDDDDVMLTTTRVKLMMMTKLHEHKLGVLKEVVNQ